MPHADDARLGLWNKPDNVNRIAQVNEPMEPYKIV
jgi:hypothetical protein